LCLIKGSIQKFLHWSHTCTSASVLQTASCYLEAI
jgi:hypothetical protein